MSDKYEMNLSWHIGVGGIDEVTKSKRYISRGLVYVPELNSFEFMSKVGGFAPRGAYFANSEANVAMKSDNPKLHIANKDNGTVELLIGLGYGRENTPHNKVFYNGNHDPVWNSQSRRWGLRQTYRKKIITQQV